MDSSGAGGSFLSGPSGNLIDLESPIHRHQQTQLNYPSLTHQHHLNMIGGLENNHHSVGIMELNSLTRKGLSMDFNKGKAIASENPRNINNNTSDEDEPSFFEDGSGENVEGLKCKNGIPWQRMKWTDDVIRLLIAVVACVDDDGEGREGYKRRSGILQKKGKWKTVSKIMISKGCHVSPQQCEDKFNDLNKRYKRLNYILGRGTSCRVVENPALMDSMPHLSSKAKGDVRKILSSKHLFYKEICAYHNGQKIPGCQDLDLQVSSFPIGGRSKENNDSAEEADGNNDSDNDDDYESENEDDENPGECDGERMVELGKRKVSEEDDHDWEQHTRLNSFEVEINGFFQDPTKSEWERREWIKKQRLHLQEQRVSFQAQAFELQKQSFKWLRYCHKKDRELERLRLDNERMNLENEQRVLQLKKKELENGLVMLKAHAEAKSLGYERMQGREQNDLGRR